MKPEDLFPQGKATKSPTRTAEGENLAELWRRYQEQDDLEARNSLAEFYFDVVRANTDNIRQILQTFIEEQDLDQSGMMAFLEALKEYTPGGPQGPFEEYASLAIRRAILEDLRELIGGADEGVDETAEDLQ